MSDSVFDPSHVERSVSGLRLRVPRGPHRGRTGDARASSAGSSLELHDFRTYQPGDDLRQVDWNAVARTGDLVLRVRAEEVAPRFELIVDGSASMAVTAQKAMRTRELSYASTLLARQAGLEVAVSVAGRSAQRITGHDAVTALASTRFDDRLGFEQAVNQLPPLRACGVRLVVSDFLFEAQPSTLVDRFARGAAQLILLQVLDADDLEPSFVGGTRLTDSETGVALDRTLSASDVERYGQRFQAHVALWQSALSRARGTWLQVSAARPLRELVRERLAPMVEAS